MCLNPSTCISPSSFITFPWLNTLNGHHPRCSGDCRQVKDNSFWELYIALSVCFITLQPKCLKQGWGAAGSERTYKRSLGRRMIHSCHAIENKFSGRKSRWFQEYLWTDKKPRGFDPQNWAYAVAVSWPGQSVVVEKRHKKAGKAEEL